MHFTKPRAIPPDKQHGSDLIFFFIYNHNWPHCHLGCQSYWWLLYSSVLCRISTNTVSHHGNGKQFPFPISLCFTPFLVLSYPHPHCVNESLLSHQRWACKFVANWELPEWGEITQCSSMNRALQRIITGKKIQGWKTHPRKSKKVILQQT